MEMMPYHPSAPLGDAAPAWASLPTWSRTTGDWTRGLPVLGDATFTLRELTLADAPTLCAQLTTEQVTRFISPPPTNVEGFETFIRWTHTRRAQGRYACFGIVPAGQTHAVGLFQLHLDETDAQTAEWGFVLGQAYWGTGLFLAGARRVVNFAFAAMGLTRLVAHAAILNGRGNGALRKLGACQTGMRPYGLERGGLQLDQYVWTLARDDWWGALATCWHRTIH
jgi:RimJ/RimL family protein N-acetyltransferase